MNLLILICLLCSVVCRLQGSETTHSSEITGVTQGLGSGEGLQNLQAENGSGGDLSRGGGATTESPHSTIERPKTKKRKGNGNKNRRKATTALIPEPASLSSSVTSAVSTTEDPCTSTHLGYCIHGYCKHIEELREPVCICMKGYDGNRCGIQTLGIFRTESEGSSNTELVQMVLVIIAVVLSVISCTAILLMTCAHYRSHKTYLASFLGTGAEQEKLQKPLPDVMV
ncbi:proheparin-binding EGF-like growth factor [Platichthys flesus]|uniref:proheparin-binding EGF-like growth factor n=1 Tax=Platichthys flesus TaxID=8260 RepID=UPI002DBE2CC8|nr:proheparin-binding EGF-like growth factor [Platichthys flesus]